MPWLILVLTLVLLLVVYNRETGRVSEISYGIFRRELDKTPPNVAKVEIAGDAGDGRIRGPAADPSGKKDRNGRVVMLEKKFATTLPLGAWSDRRLDDLLLAKLRDNYSVVEASDGTRSMMMFYLLVTVRVVRWDVVMFSPLAGFAVRRRCWAGSARARPGAIRWATGR